MFWYCFCVLLPRFFQILLTLPFCCILPNFDFFEISKSRPDKNITVSKVFFQQNYELLKIPMQKIWVKNLLWIKSYILMNSFIFKNVWLTTAHHVYIYIYIYIYGYIYIYMGIHLPWTHSAIQQQKYLE